MDTTDRTANGTAARAGRLLARLAAVGALALLLGALAGALLAGEAAATQRPEAEYADARIAMCVEDGGEVDAWENAPGRITVTCEFEHYLEVCGYYPNDPDGGCLILGNTWPPAPRPTGTRPPVVFPDDTRA